MKILQFKLTHRQEMLVYRLLVQLPSKDFRPSMDGKSVNVSLSIADAQRLIDNMNAPSWLIDKIDAASFHAVETVA